MLAWQSAARVEDHIDGREGFGLFPDGWDMADVIHHLEVIWARLSCLASEGNGACIELG